jgi:hypothetical protein
MTTGASFCTGMVTSTGRASKTAVSPLAARRGVRSPGIFGNLDAALHYLPCRAARILKFPERGSEIARLRAEIEEMRKTVSVCAEAV